MAIDLRVHAGTVALNRCEDDDGILTLGSPLPRDDRVHKNPSHSWHYLLGARAKSWWVLSKDGDLLAEEAGEADLESRMLRLTRYPEARRFNVQPLSTLP